ncbi:hypothetical protein FB451DRAFT_1148456 [Mycena latifolia]|nr:hypothetical protein FB451DRAFT_1148456 [Mycena latifolia]
MGKLRIAHHKSYHPYRHDNVKQVQRDEEEAPTKEATEEGRMRLPEPEVRIDWLRGHAGAGQRARPTRSSARARTVGGSVLRTMAGHITLFEDLEHIAMWRPKNAKAEPTETDRGVPLAPSAKYLTPWYTALAVQPDTVDAVNQKRNRDFASRSSQNPLATITHQLGVRAPSVDADPDADAAHAAVKSSAHPPNSPDVQVQVRLARESTELIRRKQRSSSVHGGGGGYSDVFTRTDVEDARAHRWRESDHRRDRGRVGLSTDTLAMLCVLRSLLSGPISEASLTRSITYTTQPRQYSI